MDGSVLPPLALMVGCFTRRGLTHGRCCCPSRHLRGADTKRELCAPLRGVATVCCLQIILTLVRQLFPHASVDLRHASPPDVVFWV